jgi:predicted dehydrogenase
MAVVGVGHLGKEHARILASLPDVELVGVADVNLDQAQSVARRFSTQAYSDYWPLLNLVDAASIVVPTTHHLSVAREFLKRGIAVLVEKPLALSAAQCQEMVDLAAEQKTILQVGHIERFNPAFEELSRRPLTPHLLRAQRMGPFTGRSTDIGVVLDLMIHDLDIVLALVKSPVQSVEATGMRVFGTHEDIASARLTFENGAIAEITASRASPTASRTLQVWGPEGFAEADFAARKLTLMQPSAEIRRNGLDPARLDPASRARIREELFTRHLEVMSIDGKQQDQLTRELEEFVNSVQSDKSPRVTALDGCNAVHLAEQVLASLRLHRCELSAAGSLFPHKVDQEVA